MKAWNNVNTLYIKILFKFVTHQLSKLMHVSVLLCLHKLSTKATTNICHRIRRPLALCYKQATYWSVHESKSVSPWCKRFMNLKKTQFDWQSREKKIGSSGHSTLNCRTWSNMCQAPKQIKTGRSDKSSKLWCITKLLGASALGGNCYSSSCRSSNRASSLASQNPSTWRKTARGLCGSDSSVGSTTSSLERVP